MSMFGRWVASSERNGAGADRLLIGSTLRSRRYRDCSCVYYAIALDLIAPCCMDMKRMISRSMFRLVGYKVCAHGIRVMMNRVTLKWLGISISLQPLLGSCPSYPPS